MENSEKSVLSKTAAVTGVIGSGKSTFAKLLETLGAGLVSADVEAHRALEQPDVKTRLIEAFGQDITDNDGAIDRKELGAAVFSDSTKLETLNKITHPAVRKLVQEKLLALSKNHELLVYDVPLLFETDLHKLPFLSKVVVYAPENICLERAKNIQLVKERMKSQVNIEKKRELADIVVDNSGSLEDLATQAKDIYTRLLSESRSST